MAVPHMTSPFRVGQRVRIVGKGSPLFGKLATVVEIRHDELFSHTWEGGRLMLVHLLNVDGMGTHWPSGNLAGAGAQHLEPVNGDENSVAQGRARDLSLEIA